MILSSLLVAALVAVIFLCLRDRKHSENAMSVERTEWARTLLQAQDAWQEERRELLNRIQQPGRIVVPQVEMEPYEAKDDLMNLAGTVGAVFDDD